MDAGQGQANLGAKVPAQRGADDARTEGVDACGRVAEHEGEVFGDVVQEDVEGWGAEEAGAGAEERVVEACWAGGGGQGEVVRVAGAEELEGHFH